MKPDVDQANYAKIEHMMLYLGLYTKGFGCPAPMFFDGAVPSYRTLFEKIMASASSNQRRAAVGLNKIAGAFLFPSETTADSFDLIGCRPMAYDEKRRLLQLHRGDFQAMLRLPEFTGSDRGDPVIIQSIDSLVSTLTPLLQIRRIAVDPTGRATAAGTGYMVRPTKSRYWLQLVGGPAISDGYSLASLGFAMAVAVSESRQRAWYVNLRFADDAPGLSFITDPTGIREFFRFRDVPDGKERRAALASWITDHWRANRHDPETEVYVREHLRGRTEFRWHGLTGSIVIPEADLKKAEDAKVARKRMDPARALRARRR